MSKERGHIKWYRDALDNPLFCKKPFDDWHAFEYLALKCRRFPTTLELEDGTTVQLDVGQYFVSRKKLADIFGWTEKKLRAWEGRLNRLNMVTAQGTRKGIVYTLKSYAFHQCEGQPQGQEVGQSEGQPQGQSKKKGKERKKKEVRLGADETPHAQPIKCPDDIRKNIERIFRT